MRFVEFVTIIFLCLDLENPKIKEKRKSENVQFLPRIQMKVIHLRKNQMIPAVKMKRKRRKKSERSVVKIN